MKRISFLRPNLARHENYAPYLAQIDESRIYSNYGPLNTLFEQRLLDKLFSDRGALTTVANATLGLMLSFSHYRRPGRYAVMPSFTFAATAQAALWCGLIPYFVDIDPESWCVNEGDLLATVRKLGSDVGLVVPYAAFGTAIDLSIYTRLHHEGIPVVVDAAASVGTTSGEQHFGVNFPGAIIFSLHATKSFPIGEGGIIYSGDSPSISKMREAANFGFTSARESVQLGLNAKLSELHAAVGLATLDEFPAKKALRQQIYTWYEELFEESGLHGKGWYFQKITGSVAHQFVPALCPENAANLDIIKALDSSGIEARTYFRPACHQQKMFTAFPHSELRVTEAVANRCVSLPLWEGMSRSDVERIVATLIRATEKT